jgi:hypothetical protein
VRAVLPLVGERAADDSDDGDHGARDRRAGAAPRHEAEGDPQNIRTRSERAQPLYSPHGVLSVLVMAPS